MRPAKPNSLYFVLSAVFAVAAAVCLVLYKPAAAPSLELDNSAFPMDGQIALAR